MWAHLIIPGNPMTARKNCQWQEDEAFATGVLYFARDHTAGPRRCQWPQLPDRAYRHGVELRNSYLASPVAHERWQAAKEKAGEAAGNKPKTPWNLWLAGGTIHTALSLFEKHSQKIDKGQVKRLFNLTGKTPMDLVIQRNTRDECARSRRAFRLAGPAGAAGGRPRCHSAIPLWPRATVSAA